MRLPLLLLLCSAACPSASQGASIVHQVPGDHPSIQAAIDAAAAHDIVLVAPGVYRECLQLRGRALVLASAQGPARTVVDAGGACRALTIDRGEGRDSRVEGFTLRGGRDPQTAGGVHIDSAAPTLRGNVIEHNQGGRLGHGLSLVASSALLQDNLVRANASVDGLHGAGGGGGIGVHGEGAAELRGNRIVDNRSALSAGGGLLLVNTGAVRVIANHIEGNRARLAGAGIAVLGRSRARIEQNLIVANVLDEPGFGGGIHWLLLPGGGAPGLVGNTIVANQAWRGAGMHLDGADEAAQVANNLVLADAGHSVVECGDAYDLAPPRLEHNLVHASGTAWSGVCAEPGQRPQAPRFEAGSWRLAAGSPGIDAGNVRLSGELLDFAGTARVQDGDGDGLAGIDIGAFETAAR